jgi:hypothetical protein
MGNIPIVAVVDSRQTFRWLYCQDGVNCVKLNFNGSEMLGLAGSDKLGYFRKTKAEKSGRIFCHPLPFNMSYGLDRAERLLRRLKVIERGYHGYLKLNFFAIISMYYMTQSLFSSISSK